MLLSTESRGKLPRRFLGRRPQHPKQALEPLRKALESHYRSLEELEGALIEFEEALTGQEERPQRPQAQQQEGAAAGEGGGLDLLSITDVCQELGMGRAGSTVAFRAGRYPR